jgi:hypothetical protein
MADAVVESGKAWVSVTSLGSDLPAIRACITSFRTDETDLDVLIESLSRARPPVRRFQRDPRLRVEIRLNGFISPPACQSGKE